MATSIQDLVSKGLDEIRQEMFDTLTAKQEEHYAKGWLPLRLNLNKGIARGLIELWCWGLWQLYLFLALVLKQAFADTATGLWLELHCKQVNVYRKKATKARGLVYFTRAASVGNVPIPAGRIVRTKPDGSGNVYRFVTLTDVVLLDASTEIAVEVEAEEYGQAANATVGQISEISTTIPGVDEVENRAEWLTSEGTDKEEDEPLRARYVLAWLEKSGCTKYAYMAWALAVTGVSEVRILDQHPRGQGTVDVIITGAAGIPTSNLVDAVETAILGTGNDDELQPINDDVEVRGPVAVYVAVSAQLEITGGDPATILAEAENRIRALFRGASVAGITPLSIGQDATIDRLRVPLMVDNVKKINWITPAADEVVAADGLAVLQSLALTYTVVVD